MLGINLLKSHRIVIKLQRSIYNWSVEGWRQIYKPKIFKEFKEWNLQNVLGSNKVSLFVRSILNENMRVNSHFKIFYKFF